jgi:AhpD family alkylhydroperoxidase
MYDMRNLTKLGKIAENAPAAFRAYQAMDRAAFEEGALSAKVKSLIAVAVGMATQCPYCIEIHGKRAVENGATDRELAEAAMVVVALRAGGAVTHAVQALR